MIPMRKIIAVLICAAALFSCAKQQPKLTADESMKKGLALFQKKDYSDSIAYFENTIMEADNPEIAAKAQLFLADAYFLDKKYPEAIPAYEQYLDIYSDTEDANLAMLRMGLSHYALIDKIDRDMGAVEGALKSFTRLREKDPGFAREYELTKKIVELRSMLSARELYVAKFYFRIGKPAAGETRLLYMFEKYKDTPEYEDGLFIYANWLAKQNGREREAMQYYNLLLKEFPQTKHAKDVAGGLAKLLAKVTADLEKKQKEAQKAETKQEEPKEGTK